VTGSKTELFLEMLLWTADRFLNPTFRNLTGSYESWAYRRGLLRQLSRLERRQLIERGQGPEGDRLYRLTAQGRLHVIGGREPPERWARSWDGQWRMVVFDVPGAKNRQREWLRRYLRGRGFGCLQNSVWITPDPMERERQILAGGTVNVESLILLEARPCAGESDSEIVAGAWDFEHINALYDRHLKVLRTRPEAKLRDEASANVLLRWAAAEREAWRQAISSDPLLPARILPSRYLGRKAWSERVKALRAAGRQVKAFGRVPFGTA
jgi:phenylacetic acid degradation operon negative regulatory protein